VIPDFTALFAFCDLHVSRWHMRRQSDMNRFRVSDLMPPMYYDKEGFPIPASGDGDQYSATLAWAKMREAEDVHVAQDDLPDGSWLSTVWIGLDHAMGFGPPLLYETMRFPKDSEVVRFIGPDGTPHELEGFAEMEFPDIFGEPGETTTQLRYTTKEEALAAHHEIVRRIRIREGH